MLRRTSLVVLLAFPLLMAADPSSPPKGWKEYNPKDRSFLVWLPENAGRRSERERTMTIRGQRIRVNVVQVEVRGGLTYGASTLLLSARLAHAIPFKERMELMRDAFLSEVKGKVNEEKEIKLGEATGKEYEIQVGRGMARLRVFARGGRLYRASVLGSKEQVSSKNADTFLESYKLSAPAPEAAADKEKAAKKPTEKPQGKADASGLKWIGEAAKMEIPDAPVAGKLLDVRFKVDEAKLNNFLGVLSLEKGKADSEIKIFLNVKRDEKLDEKSFQFNAAGASRVPRPHIHVVAKPDGKEPAKRTAFTGEYAMRLEFGTEKDGKIPAKIYLCLPDEFQSVIAGTFTVKRE
jgi:hypothetical protein